MRSENEDRSSAYSDLEARNSRSVIEWNELQKRKSKLANEAYELLERELESQSSVDTASNIKKTLHDGLTRCSEQLTQKLDDDANLKCNVASDITILRNNIGLFLAKVSPSEAVNKELELQKSVIERKLREMESDQHEKLVTLRELRLEVSANKEIREALMQTMNMVHNALSASELELESNFMIVTQCGKERDCLLANLEASNQHLVAAQERHARILRDLRDAQIADKRHESENLTLLKKVFDVTTLRQSVSGRLNTLLFEFKSMTTETDYLPLQISKKQIKISEVSQVLVKARNMLKKKSLELQAIALDELVNIHKALNEQCKCDEDAIEIASNENTEMTKLVDKLSSELEILIESNRVEHCLVADLRKSLILLKNQQCRIRRMNPLKNKSPITIESMEYSYLLAKFGINDKLRESQADDFPLPILIGIIGILVNELETEQSIRRSIEINLHCISQQAASGRMRISKLVAEKDDAISEEEHLLQQFVRTISCNSRTDRVFLSMSSLSIGIEQLSTIVAAARALSPTLRVVGIDLSQNTIGDDSVKYLVHIISEFHWLTTLDLKSNFLSARAIEQLANTASILAGITSVISSDLADIRETELVIRAMSGKLIRLEIYFSMQNEPHIFNEAMSQPSDTQTPTPRVPLVKLAKPIVPKRKIGVANMKNRQLSHESSPYNSKY